MCESLAKDKLTSPSVATFSGTTVKRDPATNAFVARGEVTAPNPLNVPITHRFICVVDPDKTGKGNVIFRETHRALYEEMVARMGV
jgi:hypothetical protein